MWSVNVDTVDIDAKYERTLKVYSHLASTPMFVFAFAPNLPLRQWISKTSKFVLLCFIIIIMSKL